MKSASLDLTVLKNRPGSYTDKQLRLRMKTCPAALQELIKRGLAFDPRLEAKAKVKARFHARRFRD
jgi:hypothetical protein